MYSHSHGLVHYDSQIDNYNDLALTSVCIALLYCCIVRQGGVDAGADLRGFHHMSSLMFRGIPM